ncbi:hypothetical protein WN51_11631 [Melipona quadrifasciata]|uniref:Uncharacterized protein n=1 Tax=Melipona quadrifasciata TaxID=166423 RepID=A0A0M9A345_9HYME|nr:hypothetical protein WN51_11631 [Melipona quadrifasciata]
MNEHERVKYPNEKMENIEGRYKCIERGVVEIHLKAKTISSLQLNEVIKALSIVAGANEPSMVLFNLGFSPTEIGKITTKLRDLFQSLGHPIYIVFSEISINCGIITIAGKLVIFINTGMTESSCAETQAYERTIGSRNIPTVVRGRYCLTVVTVGDRQRSDSPRSSKRPDTATGNPSHVQQFHYE